PGFARPFSFSPHSDVASAPTQIEFVAYCSKKDSCTNSHHRRERENHGETAPRSSGASDCKTNSSQVRLARRQSMSAFGGKADIHSNFLDSVIGPNDKRPASRISAIPKSIETSATLKTQTNPSFDASNKSTIAPNRRRSRAFPSAPALIKASPKAFRVDVDCRNTNKSKITATVRFKAVSVQRENPP